MAEEAATIRLEFDDSKLRESVINDAERVEMEKQIGKKVVADLLASGQLTLEPGGNAGSPPKQVGNAPIVVSTVTQPPPSLWTPAAGPDGPHFPAFGPDPGYDRRLLDAQHVGPTFGPAGLPNDDAANPADGSSSPWFPQVVKAPPKTGWLSEEEFRAKQKAKQAQTMAEAEQAAQIEQAGDREEDAPDVRANPLDMLEPILKQMGMPAVAHMAGAAGKLFGPAGKKAREMEKEQKAKWLEKGMKAVGEAGEGGAEAGVEAGEAGGGGMAGGAGEAAGLGAEGAGAAGMAAGAGAIGLAVGAVAKVLQFGADELRVGMKATSDTVVALAGNDYMGAFNKQVEAGAQVLGKIPVVGGALASGLELTAQPLRSFTDMVEAFAQRGKELSRYSGPLAEAGAFAEVRNTMSDLREANELGPDIAKLTDEQSRVWEDVRSILLPMKKVIVEDLVVILEAFRTTFDTLKDTGLQNVDYQQSLISAIAGWSPALGAILQTAKTSLDIKKNTDAPLKPSGVEVRDMFNAWFAGVPLGATPDLPGGPPAAGPKIPLLGG